MIIAVFFILLQKENNSACVTCADAYTDRRCGLEKNVVTVCTGYLCNVFSLNYVMTFIHEQRTCDSQRAPVGISPLLLAWGTGNRTQGLRFGDRHRDCLNHLVNL